MARTLGIIRMRWNGVNIPVEKGATYKPAGRKANAVVLGTEVNHAFEFQAGAAKGKTALKAGQRFTDLYAAGEGELQVTCDSGQRFTHVDAVLEETPEMTSGQGGEIELSWFFGPGTEQ